MTTETSSKGKKTFVRNRSFRDNLREYSTRAVEDIFESIEAPNFSSRFFPSADSTDLSLALDESFQTK